MLISYKDYHRQSMAIGDVDPSYEMLRYVCERYELNMEQRYWLAFLYSTCYCGPTVFYIYNEFPDYENVDVGRLERWWNANKDKLFFQTDRKWIKSKDEFVMMFESYRNWCCGLTQERRWSLMNTGNPTFSYDMAFNEASGIYQMGRFSLFLYLEAVKVVTGFPMLPRSMRMRDAESCRNGLAYAIGREDLNNHEDGRNLSKSEQDFLQEEFDRLVGEMVQEDPKNNVWNIETTLCAYKKYRLGKRYIGYYLDRQLDEIRKMEKLVPEGVDWSVLYDYRRETYLHQFLKELK